MGQALRNIGIVSGLTMFSRVLGLLREVAVAAVFGANALASAFTTAFTLPNLFRRLLGEGALTSAFVPTLQEESRRGGHEGALRLVNEVASWILLVTALLSGAAMALLAAHGTWAGWLQGRGLPAETTERWVVAARLGVVLFPYMVPVCLAAVFSAALQTRDRFLEPALNPVWLNLSMMGLLAAGAWFAPGDDLERMYWLCGGALLGGALQALVPAWALARLGWRPRFAPVRSEGVRQIARLMVPTLFGSAIYLVNTTMSRFLGLSLNESAAKILDLSTRVMELPIGVFAIAVATVVFPKIARHAAEGRLDLLAEDYRKGMRLILLINVPAAAGLVVLAEPVTRVLFERGRFTAEHTELMAPVLAVSALALPLVSFVSLALRAFYARKDTRTPVRAAWWSFLVNVAASLILMRWLSTPGLALAATLAAGVQAVYLQTRLAREHAGLRFGLLLGHLGKVGLASLVMAALVAGAAWGWREAVGAGGWREVAGLALCVALGGASFVGAAVVLRVEGRDELVALVKRKLGRG